MSIASIALVAALIMPSPVQDREALQAGLADALGAEFPSDVRVIMVARPGSSGGQDTDADGIVTRDEFLAPVGAAFDRLDADGDGRLTAAERAEASGPATVGPGAHFMQLEGRGPGGEDGGGRVFMFRPGGPEGRPGRDGPGGIQVERLRLGGPQGQAGLDVDRDGKISEVEFLAPLRDVFRRLDKDGDGALSGAENPGDGPPLPPPPAR
ncbi:MAG: EF-hand domain-containing protein [Caulobacteraceae bacterium]|nr:EF-hand domain-containing protein [Caulobacteraceae bacterium]